jgi:hypothetical protein
LEDEIARLERNGRTTDEKSQPAAKLLTKKSGGMQVLRVQHTGIDVMFRPWKANDPYSTVVRRGGMLLQLKNINLFDYYSLGWRDGEDCVRIYGCTMHPFVQHIYLSRDGQLVNARLTMGLDG